MQQLEFFTLRLQRNPRTNRFAGVGVIEHSTEPEALPILPISARILRRLPPTVEAWDLKTCRGFPVFEQSGWPCQSAYLIHLHKYLSWGGTVNVPPHSTILAMKMTETQRRSCGH